jgi:hypothetical protein
MSLLEFKEQKTMDTLHYKLPIGTVQSSNLNNPNTKRPKFKLEPLKVLEPSNKKLSLPEAQRIVYIVDELIKKLQIVEYLPIIINNVDKVQDVLGTSLTDEERKKNYEQIFISMCHHHKALLDSYTRGQFNHNNQSGQSKDSIEHLIKNSCKDLLRAFQLKPTLFEKLKKEFDSNIKSQKSNNVELISIF